MEYSPLFRFSASSFSPVPASRVQDPTPQEFDCHTRSSPIELFHLLGFVRRRGQTLNTDKNLTQPSLSVFRVASIPPRFLFYSLSFLTKPFAWLPLSASGSPRLPFPIHPPTLPSSSHNLRRSGCPFPTFYRCSSSPPLLLTPSFLDLMAYLPS